MCPSLLSIQSASAYVLFYRRRSEGRPVRRNILDRTLSQSFADEHKKLKEKYATLEEDEEDEEGERGKGAEKGEEKGAKELKEKLDEPEKMEAENNQEVNNNNNRSRNEVIPSTVAP